MGVLAATLLVPASSPATITVGSDLSLTPTSSALMCPMPGEQCTLMGLAVHTGNAYPAKSPTDGTVVAWGIRTGVSCGPVIGPCLASDTVTFRLIRDVPPTQDAVGVATGPTVTLKYPGPSVQLKYPGQYYFPGPGPAIHAGDYVGIDTRATWAISGQGGCGYPQPQTLYAYQPPLTNGASPQKVAGVIDCEVLVNAEVQPSSTFKLGKLQGNFKKGFAFLTVNVPGPGELSLFGKGVRRAVGSPVAVASKTVDEAGDVSLKIVPKGRAKRTLEARGRVNVKVKITFAPVGGDPNTEGRKVKLIKRG